MIHDPYHYNVVYHLYTDRCDLPKDAGPCLAYMPRWYFDLENSRCKQFIYGGCQGNKNRFMTQEDCRVSCNTGAVEESMPTPQPTARPTSRSSEGITSMLKLPY